MQIKSLKIPLRSVKFVADDKCLTVFFIALALISAFLIQTGSASAASVSAKVPLNGYCSNPKPHCYAIVDWHGHAGGTKTELDPYGSLNCQSCPGIGFIDNEMWFQDTESSQCVNDGNGGCWVEAGISTWDANNPNSCNQGHDSTCVFWADSRPYGGSFHQHPLYYIGSDGTSLDPFFFYVTIENYVGSSSNGTSWDVAVTVYKNNSYVTTVSGVSTSNNMNADDIVIGSELSATSGASAGKNYFNYNEWLGSDGIWHYQTVTARNDSSNAPPNGTWSIYPCNCSGNTGGAWETWD